MPYKLSAVLYGHKSDVRDLAVTHDDCIVSSSRDKTAKLWKPNRHNCGFTEVQTFIGHKNFVTSVCVVPPNEIFTSGLIVTGGNDNLILLFVPESPSAIQQLNGHENTVCRLVNGMKTNIIISASWDKTVKMWHLSESQSKCILTMKSHEAAVWAVLQVKDDLFISGSADKTIKFFRLDGSVVKTLTGHTDCIRDLAKMNDLEFLSCANDACIKRWSFDSGECLETLYGHPNFIYSIRVRDELFVSSGEDRCVLVWSQKVPEKLTIPAQSVWTVAILSNKDIVIGSSDGVVRIFSENEKRQADAEIQAVFEDEISALNTKEDQMIGGIHVSDLPGSETLEEAGTREGQTKMVRENGDVICYSWSVADQKWNKLGNVVSGSGGTTDTSGKVLYEGQEYDFVFSVDIEDGKAALKLPYNKSEDPWFVAQSFIHKHDLPQVYLEQVVNFIIKNAKQNIAPVAPSPSDYADPFTGGNRYVPGCSTTVVADNVDPFTGGSRYVSMDVSYSETPKNKFFPQTNYIRFDQANVNQILDKLIVFNSNIENEMLKFSVNDLKNVAKLCDISNTDYSSETLEILTKLLNWPKTCIFPVLDILRLAVRNRDINNALCSDKYMFGYLKDNLQSDSPVANQMLSFRTLCNIFSHSAGEKLIVNHKDFIIETMGNFTDVSNKSLQIALVTLALNMAAFFYKTNDIESQSVMLLKLINIFPQLTEPEAVFRALVTLGTILSQSNELNNCVDSALKQLVISFSESGPDKVKNCSKSVLNLLQ